MAHGNVRRSSAPCSISAAAPGFPGEAFRPFVDWMEGVDLSPGMIEQARRKNIYDRLDARDLTESLDAHLRADARFNLILAADVFVYCADLTLIAAAGRRPARTGRAVCLYRRDP